jgi:hypothetical protein
MRKRLIQFVIDQYWFVCKTQGKVEESLIIRSEVLESRKRVSGVDHIDTVGAMNYNGGCLRELERFDETFVLFDQQITIAKRILGENHPNLAAFILSKAVCLDSLKRYNEAFLLYDQILGINLKVSHF